MTATVSDAKEYVILVDEQDRQIGLDEKMSAHQNNRLHRAFSVFIFRHATRLELLLQQRALHKYHSPGLWTNTCCSHPRPGESVTDAGERRLREELGISTSLNDLGWFQYNAHFPNGLSENEIDHVLVGIVSENEAITVNPDEVHTCRWITLEDLQKEMTDAPERFTPWFKQALEIAKQHLKAV
jgi:isopentenyl-diphosphate delta-isomerase type 1